MSNIPWDIQIASEVTSKSSYEDSCERCKSILKELESASGRVVVAYQASFVKKNNQIDEVFDERKLEQLIDASPNADGIDLILTSGGGRALGAERIINLFNRKKERFNNSFRVIVPKLAKSAATMIALGSDQIILFDTAELGPVDPQFSLSNEKGILVQQTPAHRILKGVDTLLDQSKKAFCFNRSSLNLFLSQQNFDLYLWAQNEVELSEEIVKDAFKVHKAANPDIKLRLEDYKVFLDPEYTLTHGRPITLKSLMSHPLVDAKLIISARDGWGIELDVTKTESSYDLVWEYYFRTTALLNDLGNSSSKVFETTRHHFREIDPHIQARLNALQAEKKAPVDLERKQGSIVERQPETKPQTEKETVK